MKNGMRVLLCCGVIIFSACGAMAADARKRLAAETEIPVVTGVDVFSGAYGGAVIRITTDRPLDPSRIVTLPIEIGRYENLRYPGAVAYPQMLFFVEATIRGVDTGLYTYEDVGLVALEYDQISPKDHPGRVVFKIVSDVSQQMVWDAFLIRNEFFVTLAPFAHVFGVLPEKEQTK